MEFSNLLKIRISNYTNHSLFSKKTYRNYFLIFHSFIIIFMCLMSFISNSQNETNNWIFGERAGLNFTAQQDPQVIYNSQLVAPRGCSSISDRNGNLLIYTNGDMIFNKNHNIMSNGILVSLDNVPGAPPPLVTNRDFDQNSIIVPIANSNIYYVFTLGPNGLYYSIVDINLQNGLGEVTIKNIPLFTENGVAKISAVHHADGKSIWLMTTKKNDDNQFTSFYAYKINTNGTINDPVISNNMGYKGAMEGSIKFSPDGKKLACANFQLENVQNNLTTFDFNNETGVLSNKFNLQTSFVFFEVVTAYSVEFSQDSKYLYANLLRQPMQGEPSSTRKHLLYKYDLSLVNPAGNLEVLYEESDAPDNGIATLQLANNGKIYRAISQSSSIGTDYVGFIYNIDNEETQSTYAHNAINLSANESRLGLPNFIQSYFRTRILTKKGCINNPVFFEVDTYAEITAIEWDFGDGNTSNVISPTHTYNSIGNFATSVTITINDRQITVYKNIIINPLPDLIPNQQLIQCDNDTDGIATFNLYNIREKISTSVSEEELFFYNNLADAEQDSNRISNPENYTNMVVNEEVFVRVVNKNECFSITSFSLRAILIEIEGLENIYTCENSDFIDGNSEGRFSINLVKANIQNQLDILDPNTITLFPSFLEAQTTQNEISRDQFISGSTTLWVRLDNTDISCGGIAPISLIVNSTPIIALEDNYVLCGSNPIILTGNASNHRYEWLNSNNQIISNLRQFIFNNTGTYTHIAYKTENGIECSNSKTFIIENIESPTFNTVEISPSLGRTSNVTILVDGSNDYEFSLDDITYYGNSNGYTFNNIPAGKYTIFVRDLNQCQPTIQKEIYIISYPNFFTPNNDGINDYWRIKGINSNDIKSIKIFNRYGKVMSHLLKSTNYIWDGKYGNQLQPTNDYWFEVTFISGEKQTGHFTLKR